MKIDSSQLEATTRCRSRSAALYRRRRTLFDASNALATRSSCFQEIHAKLPRAAAVDHQRLDAEAGLIFTASCSIGIWLAVLIRCLRVIIISRRGRLPAAPFTGHRLGLLLGRWRLLPLERAVSDCRRARRHPESLRRSATVYVWQIEKATDAAQSDVGLDRHVDDIR